MAFQVKDFVSITASMINWMKAATTKITDFNVGSVARTLVEAPAAEIDELYQQMFIGIKEAVPVATFNSFNFTKLEAISATGLIRVQVTPPSTAGIVIQAGTTFTGDGLSSTYTSIVDTSIAIGASFADISVVADTPGAPGNIAEGQTFTLTPSPSDFISASNLSAFVSGRDEETDDERKLRFAAYINSISRATIAAIEYGLSTVVLTDADGNTIERVATGKVVEPYVEDPLQPIALIELYIHNGVGGTSSALITEAQKVIYGFYDTGGVAVPGYKAAGIPAPVYAASEVLVDIAALLFAEDGYDKPTLITSATSAVYAYLQGLEIGSEAVLAEITYLVKDIEGIYDFQMTAPLGNVTVTNKQKLMPGSIVIT